MKQKFIILNRTMEPLTSISDGEKVVAYIFSRNYPPLIFDTPNDAQPILDVLIKNDSCVFLIMQPVLVP